MKKSPSLPSDYLKAAMELLRLHSEFPKTVKMRAQADELQREFCAKPSTMMAAVFYLTSIKHLKAFRYQHELAEAFGCSAAGIRNMIRKISKKVLNHEWRAPNGRGPRIWEQIDW